MEKPQKTEQKELKTEPQNAQQKYYPEESARFAAAFDALRGKRVAIIGHRRPDGDCIGSQVALCRMLRATGADALCVNADPVPQNLRAFVGDTPFVENTDRAGFDRDGRIGVFTDCSDASRSGPALGALFGADAVLNIDHHISNSRFARENIVLPNAAAACEMLAAFALDNAMPFDAVTAQALYVGLETDTGRFQFPTTTPAVFEIAAELLRRGASVRLTTDSLYEHDSFARLSLLQRFLKSLTLRENGRICAGIIRRTDFADTGTDREASEGFVDYTRRVDGTDIGLYMEDSEGFVKGSLRAKEERFRVDLLGAKLNGGGHVLAAGFRFPAPDGFDAGVERVLEITVEHLRAAPPPPAAA
ncbi:MAG: DHH family phosphoesterase [Puniceicoccales bacterium]|jgi:phosphoesterase RecJ-like protein|nr:DHH family phosphoesterase [Puniceicoccales bacterium]